MARTTTDNGQRGSGLVLVTGAAGGTMGGTGRQLAEMLLQRGVPVRALVRTDDDRAAALRAAGAEVVVGDMLRIEDMEAAARGAALMFFCFPVKEGLLEATAVAALAARKAGLRGIVNLSQWVAKLDSHSPYSRKHALSEAVFNSFETPVVHLQAAIFHENVFKNFFKEAAATGKLRVPSVLASDEIPLLAGADVSGAAAAVLQDFDAYAGQALLLVAQMLTVDGLAAEFSKLLGKPVTYEATTPDAWHDMTVREWGADANDDVLVHLRALWGIVRMRSAEPALVQEIARAVPNLERVLGHAPELLCAWLGPYLKAFAAGAA